MPILVCPSPALLTKGAFAKDLWLRVPGEIQLSTFYYKFIVIGYRLDKIKDIPFFFFPVNKLSMHPSFIKALSYNFPTMILFSQDAGYL